MVHQPGPGIKPSGDWGRAVRDAEENGGADAPPEYTRK